MVNLVPTKGMISYGGGIGANPYQDRPGILCRSVKDAVTVLDAFRDTKTGRRSGHLDLVLAGDFDLVLAASPA